MNKKHIIIFFLSIISIVIFTIILDSSQISSSHFILNLRTRILSVPITTKQTWIPNETAIVIIDMWDDHWCTGAKKELICWHQKSII